MRHSPTPPSGEHTRWHRLLIHPLTVLAVGLFATAAVLVFWRAAFGGWTKIWLIYHVPLVIPFVAFCADRAGRAQTTPLPGWLWDGGLILLALLRAFVLIPGYSGHALFLTYSLCSSRTGVARVTAGLVLIEVACLKIFVWQDATLVGGILLGVATAGIFRWLSNRPKIPRVS